MATCKACGIQFKSGDALKRHTERYCELTLSQLSTVPAGAYNGKGKGPATTAGVAGPSASRADQLLADRRKQAKVGNDGKIAELIQARQGLQANLGELEHGFARVGHKTRAVDAVRLHKLGQRGTTLTGEAKATAVQYAEKLQLLKDAKIREMRLILAKAEEKEGLKDLDRKHLLDRQKKGAYELDQIEKERSAMRRQLEAAERNLQVVHKKLDTKSSKLIPGHDGSLITTTRLPNSNSNSRGGNAASSLDGKRGTDGGDRLGNALGGRTPKRKSVTFAAPQPSLEGSLLWEAHQILGDEKEEARSKLHTERLELEHKRADIEKQLELLKANGSKAIRRKTGSTPFGNPARRKSAHHVHDDPDGSSEDGDGASAKAKAKSPKRPSTMPVGSNSNQSTMPNEAQAMRAKYLAQGGANPLVLQQIQDLEQTLNATARSGSGGPGGPGMHSTGYSMLGGGGGGGLFGGQPMHLQNQLMRMELDQKRMQQDFMFSIQHLENSIHGDGAGGRVGSGKRGRGSRGGRSPLGDGGGEPNSPHHRELQRLRAQAAVLKEKQEVEDLRRALGLGSANGGRNYERDVATPLEQDHDVYHSEPYNPAEGMVLFLDFCSGLPGWLTHCTIECELHTRKGNQSSDHQGHADDVHGPRATDDQTMVNSFMEDVKIRDEPVGNAAVDLHTAHMLGDSETVAKATDRRHPIIFPHGTVMVSKFNTPNPTSYVFVQLLEGTKQKVKEKRILGEPVLSLGWTKLFLFDDAGHLCAGRWMLHLRDPPVKKAVASLSLRELPRAGPAEVCVRLVDGNLHARHMRLDIEPNRKLYFPDGPIGYDAGGTNAAAGAAGHRWGKFGSAIEFPESNKPETAYSGRDSDGGDNYDALSPGGGERGATLNMGQRVPGGRDGAAGRTHRTQGKQWGTKGPKGPKRARPVGGGKGMTKLQLRKAAKAEAAAASGRSPLEQSPEVDGETPGGTTPVPADRASQLLGSPGAGDGSPIVLEVMGVRGIPLQDADAMYVLADVFKLPHDSVDRESLMAPWQSRPAANLAEGEDAAAEHSGICRINDETALPFPFPEDARNHDTVVAIRVYANVPDAPPESHRLLGWHLLELFDGNGALVPFESGLELYGGEHEESFDNMTEDKQMEDVSIMVSVFEETTAQPDFHAAAATEEQGCPPEAWTFYERPESNREVEKPYNLKTGGFDLYIDAAKSLPRNCTISRVQGRIYNHEFKKEGGAIQANVALDASIFDPAYGDFRMEFRDVEFSPTAMIVLKINTIELQTKELCTVGYIVLNLFTLRGKQTQPSADQAGQGTKCALNEGGHQLPLFQNPPDMSKELSMEAFEGLRKVPCASLLVRLVHPPVSSEGKLLSTATVEKPFWNQAGLIEPAPKYTEGAYASAACEPTNDEILIFRSLMGMEPVLARDCLSMINGDRRLKDDDAKKRLIRSRLTKSSTDGKIPLIDMTYIVPYTEKYGVAISVDSAMNLPKAKIYYPVMRLTSEHEMATSDVGGDIFGNVKMDWVGQEDEGPPPAKHPAWNDGVKIIGNHRGERNSALIIEIYTFGEKGAKALTPVAWTMMKVLTGDHTEKSTALYVNDGVFKIPLYAGAPTHQILAAFVSPSKGGPQTLDRARAQRKIKFIDGASVTVRLTDSRRHTDFQAGDPPEETYLPQEKKYKTLAKSKTVVQVLGKKNGPPADLAVQEWMDTVISKLRS